MSRKPCKSPDCAPERDRTASGPDAATSLWLGLGAVFLDAGRVVPIVILEFVLALRFAVSFFRVFFLDAYLPAVSFLTEARLDFVTFLPFFLVAIPAV